MTTYAAPSPTSSADQVLFLSHPKRRTRDTQRYKAFRALLNGGLPSLKTLADKVLGLKIQTGAHDSVSGTSAERPGIIHPPCLLFVGGRCSGDDATLRSTSARLGEIVVGKEDVDERGET